MTAPLTFYLAARYSRREELCGYKAELEQRGHKVPARWLLGEHQVHGVEAARAVEGDGPVPAEQAVLFAQDDVEDLSEADVLIAFTEPPRSGASRGGRHVELGMALGWRLGGSLSMGPTLFTVGPLENVFHALPQVDGRFDSFADLLVALDAAEDKVHGWDVPGDERCHLHPWHKWTNWHRCVYPSPLRHYKAAQALAKARP